MKKQSSTASFKRERKKSKSQNSRKIKVYISIIN